MARHGETRLEVQAKRDRVDACIRVAVQPLSPLAVKAQRPPASAETPFLQAARANAMGVADGPSEVHKASLAPQDLKAYAPNVGVFSPLTSAGPARSGAWAAWRLRV